MHNNLLHKDKIKIISSETNTELNNIEITLNKNIPVAVLRYPVIQMNISGSLLERTEIYYDIDKNIFSGVFYNVAAISPEKNYVLNLETNKIIIRTMFTKKIIKIIPYKIENPGTFLKDHDINFYDNKIVVHCFLEFGGMTTIFIEIDDE